MGIFKTVSIIIVIFSLIAIFFNPSTSKDQYDTLFSISTFLFGIFVGFAIANSKQRLNSINELLKEGMGRLLFIYRISEVFGKEVQKRTQGLADKYLIDQIDYFLQDWKFSGNSFVELFNYIIKMKSDNKEQEIAYDKMIDLLKEESQSRKKIEALLEDKIWNFEWVTILALLFSTIFFIFYRNDGTFFSIILSIVLATSLVIIVLVLKDLDNLKWKEQSLIWAPLATLFKEIDLLPYFPDDVVKSGRAILQKGQKIRIAHYPNKYPDMTNKKIEIIEV